MLETYAVGVKLEMASNVSSVLRNVIRDVEKLNSILKESATSMDKLVRGLREMSRAQSGAGNAGRGGSSFFTPGMNEAYMNARAENANRDQIARTQRAYAEAQNADRDQLAITARKAAEYENQRREAIYKNQRALAEAENANRDRIAAAQRRQGEGARHDILLAGMGAGMAGGYMLDGVKHALTPAVDMARSRDVLAADMRLSPDQVAAAAERARETTKLAPGSTTGENMAAILDLKTVFGSLDEAMKTLPEFSKMTALFQALDRKGGGDGQQAYAAAKAMEIMGEMVSEHVGPDGKTVRTMDPERGMEHLRMMERVAVATNMRVAPSDYLALAKQARVAGMTLSDEFTFEKLPAMMQVMGGSRAGTALMSMSQVFDGGKLTPKSLAALESIGLADGKGVAGADVLRSDPLRWMEMATGRMDAKGIHGSEAQIRALEKASQRTTIAGFLADLLKDGPAILKEQQNIKNTDPNMAAHFAAVDPAAKIQQFNAAMTNLATELGSAGMGDAMKVLDLATAGLNKLGEWAHEHPTFGRIAMDAGEGLGVIATGLGALSTAIMVFGPALRLLGALGGIGGAGGAAAGAGGVGLLGRVAGASLGAPGAIAGALGFLTYKGLTKPTSQADLAERDLAASRASGGASRVLPQSPGFVPGDGYGVDGSPNIHKESYLTSPGKSSTPVQNIIYVNGRVLADVVTSLQGKDAARAPAGSSGFDTRMTAAPTGGSMAL